MPNTPAMSPMASAPATKTVPRTMSMTPPHLALRPGPSSDVCAAPLPRKHEPIRAAKDAVDAIVRTMFHATHGPSKRSRTWARSAMRLGFPASASSLLRGTFTATVTAEATSDRARPASTHRVSVRDLDRGGKTAATPEHAGEPRKLQPNAGLPTAAWNRYISPQ